MPSTWEFEDADGGCWLVRNSARWEWWSTRWGAERALAYKRELATRLHAARGGVRGCRDSQKARLYAAEREALHLRPDNFRVTLDEAQALVNKVLRRLPADPALTRLSLAGRKVIRVEPGRNGGMAYGSLIRLGVWGRRRAVVLHEVAHCVCGSHPSHGPDFARIFLKIVRRFWGREAERELRAAFKRHRVKYHRARQWAGTPAQVAALRRGQAALIARRSTGARSEGTALLPPPPDTPRTVAEG